MARKSLLRPRTLIVTAIVLLLLAGLFAGFEWIYERGLKREGLYERARRAGAERRYDEALTLARQTLVSEPGREAARELILDVLLASGKTNEAKAEARRYLDENPERAYAAMRLCQIAMREGDGDEAERLALTFADREPEYAYHVLAIVRDFRGLLRQDPQQRIEAAALMRSLASMTENSGSRADAILYSAEVGHEVAPMLPQAELIRQRAQADLKEATSAVNAAVQANKAYPYEIAVGRIRVLSNDPEEAALGAKMLRAHVSGALKQDTAVASLARYHIEREEWKDAADLARSLEDPYLWQRLCWSLRASDRPDSAIAVLEGGPFAGTPEAVTLRAEFMLRSSDPARKEEAITSLSTVVEDKSAPPLQVVRALILLASGVGADAAVAAAERASLEERNDPRLTALLAALLSAQGSEKGAALAERLARETDEPAEGRDLMRLLGGRSDAFDRFVDTQVGKGGEAEARYRLQRAFTLLARAKAAKGDQAGAKQLLERVKADLEALRGGEGATKLELAAGFELAASIGETELAGELMARALVLPGDPAVLDARLLTFARSLKDRPTLERLSAGIRGAAAGMPARAYLEVIAAAVAAPERLEAQATIARLEEAAKEPGSRQRALELASMIAANTADAAGAERLAREALADDPTSHVALDVIGAALLRRGAPADVHSFYAAIPPEARPAAIYTHIVRAHLLEGNKDQALAAAREAVRRFPASAAPYLVLAQLYRDIDNPRAALSILSLAPAHVLVVHLRAELLRQLGEYEMAERFYQMLLSGSGFRDLVAWQGLMETLAATKRTKEFVVLCERALQSGRLQDDPKASSAVHCMRGMTLESDGKAEEALSDYEESIRLDGTNWGALNNAAWYIARSMPARVAEARTYIDRAMNLKPDDPALLDTAAEVYSVQKDLDGALSLIGRALSRAPEAKKAAYTVHKAEILCRGEREEDAKALLEEVRRKFGDDPATQRARSLLWEIEGKHLQEEEPAPLPAVPEDKEERPGTGGGE